MNNFKNTDTHTQGLL